MLQSSSPLAQKQVRALPDSEQADSSQHPAFLTSSFVLTSGPNSSPWITRLIVLAAPRRVWFTCWPHILSARLILPDSDPVYSGSTFTQIPG